MTSFIFYLQWLLPSSVSCKCQLRAMGRVRCSTWYVWKILHWPSRKMHVEQTCCWDCNCRSCSMTSSGHGRWLWTACWTPCIQWKTLWLIVNAMGQLQWIGLRQLLGIIAQRSVNACSRWTQKLLYLTLILFGFDGLFRIVLAIATAITVHWCWCCCIRRQSRFEDQWNWNRYGKKEIKAMRNWINLNLRISDALIWLAIQRFVLMINYWIILTFVLIKYTNDEWWVMKQSNSQLVIYVIRMLSDLTW